MATAPVTAPATAPATAMATALATAPATAPAWRSRRRARPGVRWRPSRMAGASGSASCSGTCARRRSMRSPACETLACSTPRAPCSRASGGDPGPARLDRRAARGARARAVLGRAVAHGARVARRPRDRAEVPAGGGAAARPPPGAGGSGPPVRHGAEPARALALSVPDRRERLRRQPLLGDRAVHGPRARPRRAPALAAVAREAAGLARAAAAPGGRRGLRGVVARGAPHADADLVPRRADRARVPGRHRPARAAATIRSGPAWASSRSASCTRSAAGCTPPASARASAGGFADDRLSCARCPRSRSRRSSRSVTTTTRRTAS